MKALGEATRSLDAVNHGFAKVKHELKVAARKCFGNSVSMLQEDTLNEQGGAEAEEPAPNKFEGVVNSKNFRGEGNVLSGIDQSLALAEPRNSSVRKHLQRDSQATKHSDGAVTKGHTAKKSSPVVDTKMIDDKLDADRKAHMR